jgi:HEAT repeat protein
MIAIVNPSEPPVNSSQSHLNQAQQSADRADWNAVLSALQELLRSEGRVKGQTIAALAHDQQQAWLDLALSVLEDGDFQQRWDVIKLLPSFTPRVVKPLLERLQDPDANPDVQWFVIRALADLAAPEILPSLIQLIQTTAQPELQQAAAQVLGQMGQPIIAALTPLLTHADTRPIVAQILAQLRHPDAIPLLQSLLQDPQPSVRATAIEALSGYHTPDVVQNLIAALQDHASPVRLSAIRSLGFCFGDHQSRDDQSRDQAGGDRPGPDWLGLIQPLLHDLDLEVCRQAVLTLGRFGSAEAIQVLAALVAAPHTPALLAIDVVRTLAWTEQPSAITALTRLWPTLPGSLQQTVCQQLGRLEAPAVKRLAAQNLRDWLTPDCPEPLAQTIVTALGEIGDPEAIGPLTTYLTQAQPRLKLHIEAALKQIRAVR